MTMAPLSRLSHPATDLPEKVLQFGLSPRLRAIPDWLIDAANRRGTFNGLVVAVGLTHEADTLARLQAQDGRYTVYDPDSVSDAVVVSVISRVLSVTQDWSAVLRLARQPGLQIILTDAPADAGLSLENIFQQPPHSFVAQLTSFLYERFRDMGGSRSRGLVILSLDARSDNGLRLREAIEQMAVHNELGKLFLKWLKFHVRFCNTIASRTTGAAPDTADQSALTDRFGYTDELLTPAAPDWHWAIEGDERVRKLLGFADPDSGIVIDEDIALSTKYDPVASKKSPDIAD
jgi:tagaturonate reductase